MVCLNSILDTKCCNGFSNFVVCLFILLVAICKYLRVNQLEIKREINKQIINISNKRYFHLKCTKVRFKFSLKSLQLLFVLYGSVVPRLSAGVTLVFCWYFGVFCCSTTVQGCSTVPPVFCVQLFCVPAFLVL